MSCGVGHRHGPDPMLLWLWCQPAATAPIGHQAWESLYARGVAIKSRPEIPLGNVFVLSAAQGDETAYPYKEKKHGLFTYFLLKKLQATKGKVSLDELSEFVKTSVTRKSLVENGKSQTPSVYVSLGLQDKWKDIKLK